MVLLCTLVQTSLGPTPRKQPAMPSLLYIILRPVTTEEVSSGTEPVLGTVVLGDEVDINRFCCDACRVSGVKVPLAARVCRAACDCGFNGLVAGVLGVSCNGLICVWILVLTTSSGQVMTPASPPAVAAVAISSGNPISLLPAHSIANFRSCS